MYKKRGIFVLCCLAAVLVVGCGQKENKNTEEQIQTDNKQDTTTDYKDNLKEDETQKAEKIFERYSFTQPSPKYTFEEFSKIKLFIAFSPILKI